MEAEFGRVALGQEILNIKIGDVYLLMALVKGVQPAVGVLLEEVEVGKVVVEAVGAQVAEKPDARLLLREEKAAEVADELLNSGADRDKVEVRAQVVDLCLDKRFLNSGMVVEAINTFCRIDIDQAAFPRLKEVQVDDREAKLPITGRKLVSP